MPTHRFYIPGLTADTQEILLPESEAAHALRVLRLQAGDTCVLLNGAGLLADAAITATDRHAVHCKIQSSRTLPSPRIPIRLYVAPPKGKNCDILLKMATELGVSRISPILCRYGVSKPDDAKENWRNTLVAACKQSGNPYLPQLDAPCSFASALQQATETCFSGCVPALQQQENWPAEFSPAGVALWIGPEGGFSPEEEEALQQKGTHPLTIGNWILRVETAVPALLGAILSRLP